jgi:hypothetical protein
MRRIVLLAATALVVLSGCGGSTATPWLQAGSPSPSATGAVPTTTAIPSSPRPSPAPTRSLGPSGSGRPGCQGVPTVASIRCVEIRDADGAYLLANAVAARGRTIVAVGVRRPHQEQSSPYAVIWVSHDLGRTWASIRDVPGFDPNSLLFAVAAGGPGWVAAGWAGDHWTGTAAVWTSPDGDSWSRVTDLPSSMERVYVHAIAGDGHKLVMVGETGAPDTPGGGSAIVWSSTDGLHWTTAMTDRPAFTSSMLAVAYGAHGFVAVGEERPGVIKGEPLHKPAAWISADGSHWTRRDPPAPAVDVSDVGVSMSAVVSFGDGYAAMGAPIVEGPLLVHWVSRDGTGWTMSEATDQRMTWFRSLTPVAGGLVAVGAGLEVSRDGLNWALVPAPSGVPTALLWCAAQTDAGFVAVGWLIPDALEVWTGTASIVDLAS